MSFLLVPWALDVVQYYEDSLSDHFLTPDLRARTGFQRMHFHTFSWKTLINDIYFAGRHT